MNIKVTKNKVTIQNIDPVHSGEFKVNNCNFEFSNHYTNDLIIKAIFTKLKDNTSYEVVIENNSCEIPIEAINELGVIEIGVYAYTLEDEELKLRYSPSPARFQVTKGSFKNAQDGTIKYPALNIEQYEYALKYLIDNFESQEDEIIEEIITQVKAEIHQDIEELENNVETNTEDISDLEYENNVLKEIIDQVVPKTEIVEGKEIIFDDTIKAPFKVLTPEGNSEQESTEGKNLFNGNAVTTTNTTNWTIIFQNNVLSITHNNSYTTGAPTINLGTLASGTYVLSGTLGTDFGLYKNDTYSTILSANSTFSVSGSEEIELRIAASGIASGETKTYTNVQLESGSTATSYEQYTGGNPAPSPEFPFPIKNVTGENEVVVNSKNLLDSSTLQQVLNSDGIVRNGYYCKVPETASYILKAKVQQSGLYFGYTTDLTQPATPLGNLNSQTYQIRNFTAGTYLIVWSGTITTPIDMMFAKSETDIDYIEYQNQTKPFTLVEGQKMMLRDYLADDGIHHVRTQIDKTYLLNNILRVEEVTNYVRVMFSLTKNSISTPNGLCSHFSFEASYSGQSNHFYAQNNRLYFLIDKTLLSTYDISGVTTFLNSIPTINVEYELAAEETEAYTEEQQAQWNEIKKLQSYNGTTIITSTYEEGNAQMILKAQALKQLS